MFKNIFDFIIPTKCLRSLYYLAKKGDISIFVFHLYLFLLFVLSFNLILLIIYNYNGVIPSSHIILNFLQAKRSLMLPMGLLAAKKLLILNYLTGFTTFFDSESWRTLTFDIILPILHYTSAALEVFLLGTGCSLTPVIPCGIFHKCGFLLYMSLKSFEEFLNYKLSGIHLFEQVKRFFGEEERWITILDSNCPDYIKVPNQFKIGENLIKSSGFSQSVFYFSFFKSWYIPSMSFDKYLECISLSNNELSLLLEATAAAASIDLQISEEQNSWLNANSRP